MTKTTRPSILRRALSVLGLSLKDGARMGLRTVASLLVVMVPVIVVMTVLEATGLLPRLAWLFSGAMQLLGLPGDAALVFISGAAVNLYSAVAVAANLSLSFKQMTVLAILCLDAHNLPVECAIQKQAGTGALAMLSVRLLTGFAAALVFSRLIPNTPAWTAPATHASLAAPAERTLAAFLWAKLLANAIFLGKIVLIVMALMILVELLRRTGALRILTVLMRPVTWLAGLPAEATFTVMASSTLGLAFGAGLVIAEAKRGELTPEGQFRTNVFIGTTHSLLEDTMLFAVIGGSILWIVVGRLAIGGLAVRLFSLGRRAWLAAAGRRATDESPP